jgi:ATP-dependent Clp protease ATP-binding subunit ClpC
MTSTPLTSLTDFEELKRLLEVTEKGGVRKIVLDDMKKSLRSRVKGQDHVVDDLVNFVRRRWAREVRDRPIASMVFLGPTGTGKTELAKTITEYLYEREDNMIRVDGSDYKDHNNSTKLTGQAGVYSGAKPGIITQPVCNNPRRLILFDEIEKAWSGIYDIFLTMMGEGRLTDQNTGRVADYTQSIIVLTSNIEWEAVGKIQEQIKDPDEMNNAVKQHLRDVKAFRPEIIGRFDRVYVFKPLEGIIIAEIAVLKMVKAAKSFGLELAYVHPKLVLEAMQRSAKVKDFGIRELDRIVGEILDEPCIAAQEAGAKKIKLDMDPDSGELVINPIE